MHFELHYFARLKFHFCGNFFATYFNQYTQIKSIGIISDFTNLNSEYYITKSLYNFMVHILYQYKIFRSIPNDIRTV
jgi:hypothetical protein